MNVLNLFGITDVIIVLLFIIMIYIGWKRGFLERFVKIANTFFGIIFALIFAGRFANFIGPLFLNDAIQPKVYENVMNSDAIMSINGNSLKDGIHNVLFELGFPNFLSDMVARIVSSNVDTTAAELQHQVAFAISTQLTRFIVIVISFFILLIGSAIMFLIIKLFIKLLRTSLIFRTVDGIAGVIFMGVLFFVTIYISLLVISVIISMPQFAGFSTFMMEDMQLGNDSFRLSKYLYENNIIGNVFKIFF